MRETALWEIEMPTNNEICLQLTACNPGHVLVALIDANCLRILEEKKPFTYPDIFVEHLNDDCGRIYSDFINVSPQNQVPEDQHLIPSRTPGLPDHARVSNKVCEDNTTKGVCDQNKIMP